MKILDAAAYCAQHAQHADPLRARTLWLQAASARQNYLAVLKLSDLGQGRHGKKADKKAAGSDDESDSESADESDDASMDESDDEDSKEPPAKMHHRCVQMGPGAAGQQQAGVHMLLVDLVSSIQQLEMGQAWRSHLGTVSPQTCGGVPPADGHTTRQRCGTCWQQGMHGGAVRARHRPHPCSSAAVTKAADAGSPRRLNSGHLSVQQDPI